MAEFKSTKRLCPDSLVEELKTLRRIANRVVLGVGKYLSHEDLIAAFTLRSKRLVTQETLSEHLAGGSAPDEKIERLLFVEDNIIGAENKRQLADLRRCRSITAARFEKHFQNAQSARCCSGCSAGAIAAAGAPLRLSRRSARARSPTSWTGWPATWKRAASCSNRIEANAPTARSRSASTLLKLCTGGILTEGRLSARARELILGHLAKPGFLTGYRAPNRRSQTPKRR